MTSDYARNMQRLTSGYRGSVPSYLPAPSGSPTNTRGAASANSGGSGDPLFAALRTIQQSNPVRADDHWASGIPVIGSFVDAITEDPEAGFMDRAKAGLSWVTNDYKPAAATLRALGTTGAATAGAINEVVDPKNTPGSNPLSAAKENVGNLWNFDPTSGDPVKYNQDWIQALRERRTGKDFDEEAGTGAKVAAGVSGFALDMLTDPLSFIGAGTVSRGAQAANRGVAAGAKAVGANELAQRAGERAASIEARRGMGAAPQHRQREITRRFSDTLHEAYNSAPSLRSAAADVAKGTFKGGPITPGTKRAREILNDAAEQTKASREVVEQGTPSGRPVNPAALPESAHKQVPDSPQQSDLSEITKAAEFGTANPARLTPKMVSEAEDAVAEHDMLSDALAAILPAKPKTAVNEVTPRTKRPDADKLRIPETIFRNPAAGVGDFQQMSIDDAFEAIANPAKPAPAPTNAAPITEAAAPMHPMDWARQEVQGVGKDLTYRMFGKRNVNLKTLVDIVEGKHRLGNSRTNNTLSRLTAEEIKGARQEAARLIGQAYRERPIAAEGPGSPAAGLAGREGGDVPSAAPEAAAPRSDTSAAPPWEPSADLGGSWERISTYEWHKVQKRIKRYRDSNLISSEEYAALLRARKTSDPTLWRETLDSIMYDGHPSPIDTMLRKEADNLPQADEIIAEAERTVGKNSPVNRLVNDPLVEFEDAKAIRQALENTIKEEFIVKPATHNVSTKTAAKLKVDGDIADPTVTGRYHEGFGRYSQYTLIQQMFKSLRPEMNKFRSMDWGAQGTARYNYMMPRLEAAFKWAESQGIVAQLSAGVRGYPLNAHDVLRLLNASDAEKMFFHPVTNVPYSNVAEAVDLVIRDLASGRQIDEAFLIDNVADILRQPPGTRAGGDNMFAGLGKNIKPENKAKRLKIYRARTKQPKATFDEMVKAESVVFARAIVNKRSEFLALATEKSARYSAEVGAESMAVTREVVDNALNKLIQGEATFAERVNTIEHLDDLAKHEGNKIGAKSESVERAIDDVEEIASQKVKPEVLVEANVAAAQREVVDRGNAEAINRTQQKVHEDAVAQAQKDAPLANLEDWDAANDLALDSAIQARYGKFAEKFVRNYGMRDIGDGVHTMRAVARPMRATYRNALNQTAKRHTAKSADGTTSNFDAAFFAIQRGVGIEDITEPAVREAAKEVRELVDFFFSTSGVMADDTLNRFVLNGFDFGVINGQFARNGMDHIRFDMQAAKDAVKAGRFETEAQALGAQWRDWTINDPQQFLSVAENALNHVATIDAIARQGVYLAKRQGFISSKPKPGFVRYRNSGIKDGEVALAGFLDKNTFIDKRIVDQFAQMENVLNQSLTPNSPLGKWISNNVLPTIQLWKSGMTIWNARNWFLNFWGDIGLNQLAGVVSPAAYYRAARMMAAKGTYNGMWDGAAALKAAGGGRRVKSVEPNLRGNSVVVKSKNGLNFTADEVFTYMRDNGVFVSYPVRYDMLEDMIDPTRMQQFQGKLEITGGRAKTLVSAAHEIRDHSIRGAHVMDILAKGKWRNKRDALEEAAAIVRKWHPDGSDLQHFEQKYMRVLMPFYSWTRRALPLVIEAMLTNPQRVMAYPKAYYNFASSMGIDMHSLSDPFPVDQMFPEYLTDRLTGPAQRDEEGNYIGYQPGHPVDDLTGWFNDPTGEAISMLSPALKVPIELAMGKRFGSGTIRDTSDYIDSNIPFVNTAANVTGISPFGTLYNAATGNANNTQEYGSTLDRQANIERDLKEHWDMNALVNWLTGLRRTNMSAPNIISRAEFEERDRVTQDIQRNRFRAARDER